MVCLISLSISLVCIVFIFSTVLILSLYDVCDSIFLAVLASVFFLSCGEYSKGVGGSSLQDYDFSVFSFLTLLSAAPSLRFRLLLQLRGIK